MMKRLLLLLGIVSGYSVSLAGISYINSGDYQYDVRLYNSDKLIVMGGGADRITSRGYSSVEVQYTSTPLSDNGGIWDIFVQENSQLLYLNGETEEITLSKNASAVLKGGRIDGITTLQQVFNVIVGWDIHGNPLYNTHIEMFVKDYFYNVNTQKLTGTWGDGSAFNIKLIDVSGYDRTIDNIKFTIIPEPTSLLLVGLGGLLLRRKRS
ncbi:MAG: PEP-CTERM sorting domain-containing protein [Anaerohalosphaeraceae bacterium]